MKKKLNLSALLLVFSSVSSWAKVAALPPKAVPAPPPAQSFSVVSPIKEISYLRDGIMSEAPAGKALPAKVGVNEVLFTAPGYGIRKIRFRVEAGEKKVLNIDLAKSVGAADPIWKTQDRMIAPARLTKDRSVCAWFQDKTNDGSVCQRQTYLDDVVVSEPGLFLPEDMRALQSSGDLKEYRRLLHQVYTTTDRELTQSIENLYARRAGLRSLMQLNALHNFLRGDCPRVHAIWADAQQVLASAAEIGFYRALCTELNGEPEQSQALLQNLIKAQKPAPAYLYFHAGRQLLLKTPVKSWELANSCVLSSPFDLPCQELGAMAARLDNKFFKTQRFNLEDGTFKTLLGLEENLPKGKFDPSFMAVSALIQTYPQSIEFYLFLSWIESMAEVAPRSGYAAKKMEVARLMAGGTLDKIIDAIEKSDKTFLLIPVYRNKLKTAGTDPNLWFRLIRAHAKAEECDQVLAVIQEGGQVLPKYSVPLLQIQASCLINKSKFKEALEVYLKVAELKPKSWSTYYNLAAVYERLKMTKEAIAAYRETLANQPPNDVKDDVQYRLLEFEK